MSFHRFICVIGVLYLSGCTEKPAPADPVKPALATGTAPTTEKPATEKPATEKPATEKPPAESTSKARVHVYTPVTLTADLSHLSQKQKDMIGVLIDASKIMDELFWRQTYGDRKALDGVKNAKERRFIELNYGPWDRLAGNAPFIEGVGPKPKGARFYPTDMTKEEFEAAALPGKKSLYSVLRRDADGKLTNVPYREAFKAELTRASALITKAQDLAEDKGFKTYLGTLATALLKDDYLASDMAWMETRTNPIEFVYGPIETYEDKLFGYKASFEAYILLKDQAWSARLARFAQYLPALQKGLPVPERYKQETPGSDAQVNAYDVIYYAGDCNAGSKTIAINLPNDERVQLKKGTRRLQLKNAMRAKFDKILMPIAGVLVAKEQQKHITFDAFFSNTMFHEVAHGLGIKSTLTGKGTVRKALKETSSALEEGKADILGLYMITSLHKQGVFKEGELLDYYVTFLAGIFRSIRFGASSAHGRANMIRFNFFSEHKAFTRDAATGTYRVNVAAMQEAVTALSKKILMIQGDGDYAAARELVAKQGVIGPQLKGDLERLAASSIPIDVVFEQGRTVLGL